MQPIEPPPHPLSQSFSNNMKFAWKPLWKIYTQLFFYLNGSLMERFRLGKVSLEKKKKVWNFTLWGGGQDKIGSFSHFFYFFSFMS